MSLTLSLRSEVLKTKRTAAFYFTLIGAAVIPFMMVFVTATNGLPREGGGKFDPINFYFKLSGEIMSICIFPIFIILSCTLLPQIEYRNNTWKQVLTSPQTKLNVFTAKLLNTQLSLVLFMVTSFLLTWVVVIAAHFMVPKANVLQHSFDFSRVLNTYGHIYVSVLALCAIQFWLGLRYRNFLVPTAIGLACYLVGTIMAAEYHSTASPYNPYSFHVIRLLPEFKQYLTQVEWTSFGYAIAILFLAFMDFKNRKMGR